MVTDYSGQPLPDTFAPGTTELILSGCKLNELPGAAVAQLSDTLRRLDASSNGLTSLPGMELSACKSLTSLELYANKLKDLPAEMGALAGLQTLNSFNNALRKLPDSLGGLSALEEFNAAANKLMMLTDKHFASWGALRVLQLSDNNLVRLGSLAPLLSLEELRLSANNLEEMPSLATTGHLALSVFEIHKNRISSSMMAWPPRARYMACAHGQCGPARAWLGNHAPRPHEMNRTRVQHESAHSPFVYCGAREDPTPLRP